MISAASILRLLFGSVVIVGVVIVVLSVVAAIRRRRSRGPARRKPRGAALLRTIDDQTIPYAQQWVDPEAFPEDQYPTYCPACDYPTRGINENRCPECGTIIVRSRLIVDQYAFGKPELMLTRDGRPHRRRPRIWPYVLPWASGLTLVGALAALPSLNDAGLVSDAVRDAVFSPYLLFTYGLLMMAVAVRQRRGGGSFTRRRDAIFEWKREQVLDALVERLEAAEEDQQE